MRSTRPHRFLVALLCMTAATLAASAQHRTSATPPDPLSFGRPAIRIFTDKDGLPQNAITALAFDSNNHLWAATKDGAAFYNGRQWQTLNMPRDLGSNWVQCILVDSDGMAWFGTLGGGIGRYDGKAWKVYDESSGLPGAEVNDLIETTAQDGSHTIVAATNRGVARFEQGVWTVLPPLGVDPLRNVVQCVFEQVSPAGEHTLWAGTAEVGLGRYRSGRWTFFTKNDSGLPDDRIRFMDETAVLDGEPTMVIGTYGGGLVRCDNGKFTPYSEIDGAPRINALCMRETKGPDGASTLWIGTDEGLVRYCKGRWETLGANLGLPATGVWSLLDSPSPGGARTLWIGTAGGGVVRWEQGCWVAVDARLGLPNNSVYSLLETRGKDGEFVLWAGTVRSGLSRFQNGTWTNFSIRTGFPVEAPLALLETREAGVDTVWIGSFERGVFGFRDGRIVASIGAKEGLAHQQVTTLLETKAPDGSSAILVGTVGGLSRIEHGRVVPIDPAIRLPDPRVRCLLETHADDGARTLWIGTDRGLARFAGGTTTVYDTGSGLPNNVVLSVHEVRAADGHREIWAGTRGGGVGRLRLGPGGEWRSLSTSTVPAIPNDTVYQIREDRQGRIYLFTNKGIARLTPRRQTDGGRSDYGVYVFTIEDGLPSNECNTGASMVDSYGRIWAGTIGGLAVLDPAEEIIDPTPKPLRIESAFLVNQFRVVSPTEALAYDENHLVFQYALLSFFRESDTRYQTQLIGFDPAPSGWSADFKKEYTSLPEGHYTFKVWGRDAAGNVSGPVSIPFSIRPAPWFTWWAYLTYLIAALGLLYMAVRIRIHALRRRNLALEARIADRTVELAQKVEQLRVSEQHALDARNEAVESEQRARESERVAVDANRAKTTFLANMSHELRTPLNAILGFVQLMERDERLSVEQRENLGVIMRSGEHLLALINDILSLSKIEAGRATLDVGPFDLRHLLQGIEEMFRLRAELKGLQLFVRTADAVPQFVLGDESKIRQILINLLGNAVKFTSRGSVSLTTDWNEGRALFTIADTGPGMSPEEMSSLFRAFVQTQSGVQSQEGTGLGLAISRDYAILMDGDIRVESEVGRGATFRLEISLPTTEEIGLHVEQRRVVGLEPGQPTPLVLVVDDLVENRTLLRKLFTAIGMEVGEASNGLEAVDVWARLRPDVVLMDVRMPVMDGIEATREIRRLEGSGDRCAIIALTASAFDHDRTSILEAGGDDYIPKPFREAVVFDKLTAHTGIRFTYEESQQPEATGPFDSVMTAERVASLPHDILEALALAVTIGDAAAALDTVNRIREHDTALANEIRMLVRNYQFDALLEVLAADERK